MLAEPTTADGLCRLRGVDIRRIPRAEFGTAYARSSVHYLLHRTLGFSYLKLRPLHAKTAAAAQDALKKTSRKSWPKSGRRIRTSNWKSGSKMKPASVSKAR